MAHVLRVCGFNSENILLSGKHPQREGKERGGGGDTLWSFDRPENIILEFIRKNYTKTIRRGKKAKAFNFHIHT